MRAPATVTTGADHAIARLAVDAHQLAVHEPCGRSWHLGLVVDDLFGLTSITLRRSIGAICLEAAFLMAPGRARRGFWCLVTMLHLLDDHPVLSGTDWITLPRLPLSLPAMHDHFVALLDGHLALYS